MSGRIFVDSSAYLALTSDNDDNHGVAVTAWRRLSRDGTESYTANFVAAETHGLILNRINRDTAIRVLDGLYASATRIIRATEGDERRALEILRRHTDKEYSLVDAISFAVMDRLHIHDAWTYDHHFAQFGFNLVP